MNKLAILLVGLLAFASVNTVQANGPEKVVGGPAGNVAVSPGEIQPTPDMWFYGQAMQQYMDPRMAVRHKAELQTAARERRLESLRWFGYSNSRPRANCDPMDNLYAPQWGGNTLGYPSLWTGYGATTSWTVVPVERVKLITR